MQLTWGTLVEVDVLGFKVDRSTANGGWERITPRVIAATGWNQRPPTYALVDSNAPTTPALAYRLVGIDLRGQEDVLAEALVQPGLAITIARITDGLSLHLSGAPNTGVTVETAATVTGPWAPVQTLTLDGTGAARVILGQNDREPVRFYRVLAE